MGFQQLSPTAFSSSQNRGRDFYALLTRCPLPLTYAHAFTHCQNLPHHTSGLFGARLAVRRSHSQFVCAGSAIPGWIHRRWSVNFCTRRKSNRPRTLHQRHSLRSISRSRLGTVAFSVAHISVGGNPCIRSNAKSATGIRCPAKTVPCKRNRYAARPAAIQPGGNEGA